MIVISFSHTAVHSALNVAKFKAISVSPILGRWGGEGLQDVVHDDYFKRNKYIL